MMGGADEHGRPLLAGLAEAVLDPVLHGSPFARGHGSSPQGTQTAIDPQASPWPAPEHSVQLIWCASFTDVRDELPGLWRQVRRQAPDDGRGEAGCVDLVVDLDVLGRLVAVDLETVPLDVALRELGDLDAARAAGELPGLSAEVAMPAVADLLERLLVVAGTG